jgi:hypothetical protein
MRRILGDGARIAEEASRVETVCEPGWDEDMAKITFEIAVDYAYGALAMARSEDEDSAYRDFDDLVDECSGDECMAGAALLAAFARWRKAEDRQEREAAE